MRDIRLIIFALFVVVLAGCRSAPRVGIPGGGGNTNNSPINWQRDADHVVFRIDVVGGEDTFVKRNEIPLCTVYGDNRVVWTDNSQPGRVIVLFDVVDDLAIYDFIEDLTVNRRIYTYGAFADQQLPGEVQPVYEQILLNVNNTEHITDGFEDWPSGYFREVLQACQTISSTPALFEPAGGWLSAQIVEVDADAPIVNWSAEASGLDLVRLAESGERVWVDDENLPIIWNIMTNSPGDRLFGQEGQYVVAAFEVPSIHRSAPPPPTPEELDAARTIEGGEP